MYFYWEHSNVTWEEFLTTKFGLWIYVWSNTLHDSGKTVGKYGILLQIKKGAGKSGGVLTCHMFSLEDAVVHLATSDRGGFWTIEK